MQRERQCATSGLACLMMATAIRSHESMDRPHSPKDDDEDDDDDHDDRSSLLPVAPRHPYFTARSRARTPGPQLLGDHAMGKSSACAARQIVVQGTSRQASCSKPAQRRANVVQLRLRNAVFCLLPDCPTCGVSVSPGADVGLGLGRQVASHQSSTIGCSCFLPDCMTCSRTGREVSGATSSRALPKREWNTWKGRAALETTLRLVASVHDEMQMMLDAPGAEQILGRGQGWSSLPSGDSSKGSRLEKVVARLCRCGITTVMQARLFFSGR